MDARSHWRFVETQGYTSAMMGFRNEGKITSADRSMGPRPVGENMEHTGQGLMLQPSFKIGIKRE